MKYNIELLKEANYKPTFWSDGMAKELATYPLDSDYASRNFLWRLGVAKIDIPESTFSNLPKVSRKFMVMEGQITLQHENKYTKLLNTFEQDDFMGDWNTKTDGKAYVFNLMTKENYSGELIHLTINPSNQLKFQCKTPLNKTIAAICFYLIDGEFNSTIDGKVFTAAKNNLVLINCITSNNTHEFELYNNSSEFTNIIVSIIYGS